jgi:fibronectin type 3 domain-containing protein
LTNYNGKRIRLALSVLIAVLFLSSLATISLQAVAGTSTQQGDLNLGAPAVPSEPLNLVADQGPGFVWLWWDHPATQGSDLIKTYEIWRGTSSDGETLLDTIYVGNTTFNGAWMGGLNIYNDTSVVLDTTYWYKIKAVSDAGASAFSNEVESTPSLTGDAPGASTATAVNEMYGAQVNWTIPADQGSTPVRFYFLYREPGLYPFLPESWEWLTDLGVNDNPIYLLTVGIQYNYTVYAVNSYGLGEVAYANVTIGGTGSIPTAPTNLWGYGYNETAQLWWSHPVNPSATGFTRYDIYRATNIAGPYSLIGNYSLSYMLYWGGFYADHDLTNGQTYHYKVNAINSNGASGFSNVISVTPQADPTDLTILWLDAYPGDGKVYLDWGYAYNETGYSIFRSESTGTEVWLADTTSNDYFDTTVVNGHTYYYVIKALRDSEIGPASPEASASPTTGAAPDAPFLAATPSHDGVMLYSPPTSTTMLTSPMLSWRIYRGTTAGGEDPVPIEVYNHTSFSSEFNWVDDTALPDVNYFYTIKVEGMYGLSTASNEASTFMSPTGDVPDPVTTISAVGQVGSIEVSWDSPAYQGTAILLSYDLERNDSSGGWDTILYSFLDFVGTSGYTDNDVIPGVTYTYRVLASNEYGEASAYSPTDSAAATQASQAPSAPRSLTSLSGAGFVELTWLAPTSQGSSAIIRYDIYRGTTAGGETLLDDVVAGTLTYNDTSAVVGQPYSYYVKAVNSVGSSPSSNVVSGTATTIPSVPNMPQNLVATGHNGYVILTWQAPSSPGTSPIIRYDIFRGTSATTISMIAIDDVAAGTLTYNDSAVTNGQPYYYLVTAVNAVGLSVPSTSDIAQATPSVTGTAPGAPTSLAAVGHVGYIQLSWVAPTDAGSGVSNYLIFRGTTAGGEGATPLATVLGGSLTYTDTSATPEVPYYYKVKANNSNGASAFSNEANGTATAETPGTPSAPQSLVATPGAGKVTLTWQAPANNGGSAITGYKVYRSSGGSAATLLTTLGASILTYEDTTGTAGTTYSYFVVATNANGSGQESTPVNAAPQANAGGTDNTMLYIGIGVVAVVVVAGLGAFMMMRRKK